MIKEVEELKEYKVNHGITNEQLSKAMDVSKGTVRRWLNGCGNPGENSLYKICEYLEMAKKAESGVDRTTIWGCGTIPRPKGAYSENGIFSF